MPSHLTATQRTALESELKQRQQQLDQQIAQHLSGDTRAEHAREVLQQDSDDLRRRGDDRAVDMARSDNELRELGAVSAALLRLNGTGFGVCADCEAPIPYERLKLEPWALRCVACESALEAASGGVQRPLR
jgi:DnaK suppressor protein